MGICADYTDIFYLDYDGDCVLDIVMHCSPSSGMMDLQFYKGSEQGKFKPERSVSIDGALRLLGVTFADLSNCDFIVDFDGLDDVVWLAHTVTGELLL